jgi:hypothetical protein
MKVACAILTRHSFSALLQSNFNPSHKRLSMIENDVSERLLRARIFTSRGIKR